MGLTPTFSMFRFWVFIAAMFLSIIGIKAQIGGGLLLHVALCFLFVFGFFSLFALNRRYVFFSEYSTSSDEKIEVNPTRFARFFSFLGFSRPNSRFGFLVVVLYVLFSVFLWFFIAQKGSNAFELFFHQFKSLEVFLGIFFAPFYEELFFRGSLLFLFHNLANKKGWKALLWVSYFSALIFWMFHAPADINLWNTSLSEGNIPLSSGPFLLGLVCAIIALIDRSLLCPFVFHVVANAFGPFWADILSGSGLLPYFYSLSVR